MGRSPRPRGSTFSDWVMLMRAVLTTILEVCGLAAIGYALFQVHSVVGWLFVGFALLAVGASQGRSK